MRPISKIQIELSDTVSQIRALCERCDLIRLAGHEPRGTQRALDFKRKRESELRGELSAAMDAIDTLLEARELADDRGAPTAAIDAQLAKLGWT